LESELRSAVLVRDWFFEERLEERGMWSCQPLGSISGCFFGRTNSGRIRGSEEAMMTTLSSTIMVMM
jgi:hypothetical protein